MQLYKQSDHRGFLWCAENKAESLVQHSLQFLIMAPSFPCKPQNILTQYLLLCVCFEKWKTGRSKNKEESEKKNVPYICIGWLFSCA